MTLFPEVLDLMRARGLDDRLLTGGGIIPAEDMDTLAKSGVGKLFGPGASTGDIARYIREWFAETHHSNGKAAATPKRRPRAAATRVKRAGGAKAKPKRAAQSATRRSRSPARPKTKRAKSKRS
jgi:hypothetical protein